MRRETLVELCARHGIDEPADTRGQHFDNFGGFLEVYRVASSCIRSREDLARLILEIAEDARAQGAWWIEPAFDGDRFAKLRDGSPHRIFGSPEETFKPANFQTPLIHLTHVIHILTYSNSSTLSS